MNWNYLSAVNNFNKNIHINRLMYKPDSYNMSLLTTATKLGGQRSDPQIINQSGAVNSLCVHVKVRVYSPEKHSILAQCV